MSQTDELSSDRGLAEGRFQLLRRLGAGASGIVFEALDRERGERVALKSLRVRSADATFRLKSEFRALQGCRHPNLVCLGELFCDSGQWFFTMELILGGNFLDHVRVGRPAEPFTETTTSTAGSGLASRAAPVALPDAHSDVGFDEVRLRSALVQLTRGLAALHAAGKVHRDVKPSNVLVDGEGRVVLVDFDAIADAGAGRRDYRIIGTPEYMAPEQAAGAPVEPAADWFSAGVLLYQALSGRLPFAARPHPVAEHAVVLPPHVPADLVALCRALLAQCPSERPDHREILRRLQGNARHAGTTAEPTRPFDGDFVGRKSELERLRELSHRSRTGHLVKVAITGASGVGKSALARRFVAELERDALVLAGRCYEREVAYYKAMDEVIDRLTEHLLRQPAIEIARLLPRHAQVLVQLFPVLARVPALALAHASAESCAPASSVGCASVDDAHALRQRGFAALRELFLRLCDHGPLVLLIDDLQWADPDSFTLLTALLAPPEPPPLLLVAIWRESRGSPAPAAQLLAGAVTIPLSGLAHDDAVELAALHLRRSGRGTAPGEDERVAIDAEGHPLLIAEVARWLDQTTHAVGTEALAVQAVVFERISRLDAPDRRLLEFLAVAGKPVARGLLTQAAGSRDADTALRVDRLSDLNLLRTSGGGRLDPVELFHDRVGTAVQEHLDRQAGRAAEAHARWAQVLETQAGVDPAALVLHWQEAGERTRASGYARLAAREAARALAFDRAAELFERALVLRSDAAVPAQREVAAQASEPSLEAELAEACANAGQGKKAARFFLAAAVGAASERARLAYRQRAAEQLLRSGYIDEGLAALDELLACMEMPMPRSARGVLLGLGARRAQLRLRGLDFQMRSAAVVDPELLARIDCCWSVASGLAVVDTVRGAYYQTRQLLLALAAGEPARVAIALAAEGAFAAAARGRGSPRVDGCIARARELAGNLGDRQIDAVVDVCAGAAAYVQGKFAESAALCMRAEELLRDRCAGMAWERDTARLFAVFAHHYLGDLATLARLVPAWIRDAATRGDVYLATNLRAGLPNMISLVHDDPAAARQALTGDFGPPQRHYYFQQYQVMLAECGIDLYVGDGAAAHARVTRGLRLLRPSLLLQRVPFVRVEAMHLRARCALAAAAERPAGAKRRPLLADATSCAAELVRAATPASVPFAALARAGVAALSGQAPMAATFLDVAERGFVQGGMKLYEAAAVWQRRRLDVPAARGIADDDEGREAWWRAQGVARADRMVAMLAPGFR